MFRPSIPSLTWVAALVSNFSAQWLHLRNLESTTPDARLYLDGDDD